MFVDIVDIGTHGGGDETKVLKEIPKKRVSEGSVPTRVRTVSE